MTPTITNLKAAETDSSIAAAWGVGTEEGLGAIRVYLLAPGGQWEIVTDLAASARSYTYTKLSPATGYKIRVRPLVGGAAVELSVTTLAAPPVTPPAPVLSVDGTVLHWAAIPGVSEYTLAIIRNIADGRETTYETVTGTSFEPVAVPGQTITYGLAAHAPVEGPWATEVSIAYPAEPTPAPPHGVRIAVNDGAGWGALTAGQCTRAGITGGRCSGSAETPASMLAAGFEASESVVITQDVADAKAAIALGVKLVEYGNERYVKESPQAYAAGFVAWAHALQGLGATLLFDGYGGTWMAAAVAAQPTLKTLIGGVSFHPYGPVGKSTPGVFGLGHEEGEGAMEEMHSLCVTLGIENPAIYITEWGQEVEGSLAGQASKTKAFMAHVLALPYVRYFAYYQTHDDSTGQWGLFDSSSVPREVFQVVAEAARTQ
jgi:hypothetical protein